MVNSSDRYSGPVPLTTKTNWSSILKDKDFRQEPSFTIFPCWIYNTCTKHSDTDKMPKIELTAYNKLSYLSYCIATKVAQQKLNRTSRGHIHTKKTISTTATTNNRRTRYYRTIHSYMLYVICWLMLFCDYFQVPVQRNTRREADNLFSRG